MLRIVRVWIGVEGFVHGRQGRVGRLFERGGRRRREVEGGGVVGAVFFHVFNFFPLKISYKTTFLLFCVFFTKLSVITNFVRTGAFSFLRPQTSLQFCILYNFKSFGT